MQKSIHSARYQVLLDWLVTARHSAGLTQQQLAKLCGIATSHVCMIETGNREPSLHLAIRLSRELNATVEELVG